MTDSQASDSDLHSSWPGLQIALDSYLFNKAAPVSVNLDPLYTTSLDTLWQPLATSSLGFNDTTVDSAPHATIHLPGPGDQHAIAYVINPQGDIFPIMGQAPSQMPNSEGYSQLHFLGFLILVDSTVKPFFVSPTYYSYYSALLIITWATIQTDQSCFFQVSQYIGHHGPQHSVNLM